jgi:arginine utilization regulatory protein
MNLFKAYSWPGNVRELEHVIEGAMNIVGTDEEIRVQHLQTHFSNWSAAAMPETPEKLRDGTALENYHAHSIKKADQEEYIITNALLRHKGNITRTARSLGISRQLLYYKLKKYNISRN